ncbi:hypothetical protein EV426DRAFT_702009 [Tirmania nivea]|nr:hypothetical protein EV426DRAFT_702009 [Tirmania nivea]
MPKLSAQCRPGIVMPLNDSQITDTTIHSNKRKSCQAVIEDKDEKDKEVDHNAGDNEAGSDNEDDPDLSLEEGSNNENWLITQEHTLDLIMTEEDE